LSLWRMLCRRIFSANIISVNAKALFPFAFSLYGERSATDCLGIHCLFLRRIVIETINASFFNTHAFSNVSQFTARSWFIRTDYFSWKDSPRIVLLRESSSMLNRRDSVTREKVMPFWCASLRERISISSVDLLKQRTIVLLKGKAWLI